MTPSLTLRTWREQEPHRSQRHARTQMRRLITISGRATGRYETTIGAVAKAIKKTPEETIALLRDQWLLILNEDPAKPIAEWTLEEDGE